MRILEVLAHQGAERIMIAYEPSGAYLSQASAIRGPEIVVSSTEVSVFS